MYEEESPCGAHRVGCVLGGCGYHFWCEGGTGGLGGGKRLVMVVVHVMLGTRAVRRHQNAGQ